MWLKDPDKYFPKEDSDKKPYIFVDHDSKKRGICVGKIQEKANVSQSTISQYLSLMQNAGLLKSVRDEQWTYYQRNEETLKWLSNYFKTEI